jgi:hypothetical protein
MGMRVAKVGRQIRVLHAYAGGTRVKHAIVVSLASQISGTARIGNNTAIAVTRSANGKTWTW